METQFLGVASINGVLSNIWETKIPLSDRGFLFGHSIFETLLVKNGKIIDWKQHYARMILSCNGALINPPDEDILLHWAKEAISENMLRSKFTAEKIQLRIIISGGNSFDLPIKRENSNFPKPNITMICRNVTGPSKEQYIDGVSLKTIPDLRAPALIDIKSCSYLYNLKALEKAKSEDYDDALFYNTHNMLTECTTANFVWFDKNYSTYTAPFKGSCLAGITLTTLIAGMKKNNIMFDWKELSRTNIPSVKGCCIISSIRGIVPVRKIDETHFDTHSEKSFFEKLNLALQSEES